MRAIDKVFLPQIHQKLEHCDVFWTWEPISHARTFHDAEGETRCAKHAIQTGNTPTAKLIITYGVDNAPSHKHQSGV